MSKKKVVFLINSLDGGGAERVVSRLLNYYCEDNECFLIVIDNIIKYNIDPRVKIITLNKKLTSNSLLSYLELPLLTYRLSKIIKENKINTLISFLHKANYINILSKFLSPHKAIVSERRSLKDNEKVKLLPTSFLIKKLYNHADLIISVSKFVKYNLETDFKIKTRNIVIYNPYDIQEIRELSKEKVDINTDRDYNIICVSNFLKRKNHEMILKAFFNLDKKYNLYLLGGGALKSYYKKQVSFYGLENRVHFIEFDNNPYKYMSRCSISILTSNSEGFPNTIIESLICGCNIIATDCYSGPREILSPNSSFTEQKKDRYEIAPYGILVPINDYKCLNNSIKYLKKDIQCQNAFLNKTKYLECFDIKKIAPKYYCLFND